MELCAPLRSIIPKAVQSATPSGGHDVATAAATDTSVGAGAEAAENAGTWRSAVLSPGAPGASAGAGAGTAPVQAARRVVTSATPSPAPAPAVTYEQSPPERAANEPRR
jgi:hypothetical protein